MKLALDFSGLLPAALGPEIGLDRSRLTAIAPSVTAAHANYNEIARHRVRRLTSLPIRAHGTWREEATP